MKRVFFHIAAALAMILSLAGCRGRDNPEDPGQFDDIFILYSAGKNNISGALQKNIKELQQGYVPYEGSGKACIIVTHSSPSSRSFETDTTPYIIRMYKDRHTDEVVMDTLLTLPSETMLTRASDMNSIMNFIKDNFKSDRYGMVFTSHGTGWLPKGYYDYPEHYDKSASAPVMAAPAFHYSQDVAIYDAASIPESPLVKSLGQEYTQAGSVITSYELTLSELVDAIPFDLEYLILDACLMGGIETAYELKEKCRYIAFSQAEILTEGFDYSAMGSRLMESANPDVKRVCEDYYNKYKDRSGSQCSATVSLIDCSKLQYLASVCRQLFESYRDEIAVLSPRHIQQFSRNGYLWFFDLQDILVKAGCSGSELSSLNAALDQCVLYKASTKRILNVFDVNTFCGLSMFLPRSGSDYLNEFYKTLAWNEATSLVN